MIIAQSFCTWSVYSIATIYKTQLRLPSSLTFSKSLCTRGGFGAVSGGWKGFIKRKTSCRILWVRHAHWTPDCPWICLSWSRMRSRTFPETEFLTCILSVTLFTPLKFSNSTSFAGSCPHPDNKPSRSPSVLWTVA